MRPLPDHLYVATDGTRFKIGITSDPAARSEAIKAEMVKVWRRPYARRVEASIKAEFSDRCVEGQEWFAVTEDQILEAVRKNLRVEDDYQAMQRGIEPSRRPGPGEPPHQPPFELDWLEMADKS